MKKFILALRIVSAALVALLALVFLIIEATLLVTLDFTLCENQFIAFIQITMKLILSIAALALGILSIAKPRRSFLSEGVCLVVSGAVMIPFVSNNFGLYFISIAALFLLSHLLFHKFGERKA